MFTLYASIVLTLLVFLVAKLNREHLLDEIEEVYRYIEDEIDDVYRHLD